MRSVAFVNRLALEAGDIVARIHLFNSSNQLVLLDLLSLLLDPTRLVEKTTSEM